MVWSNPQKANVARACAAIGLDDAHRLLILGQCGGRAEHPKGSGKNTSTSPRLTQPDYEQTMAVIEQTSGGRIQTTRRDRSFVYQAGEWGLAAAEGDFKRLCKVAQTLADGLAREFGEDYVLGVISRAGVAWSGEFENHSLAELRRIVPGLRRPAHRVASSPFNQESL